MFQVDTKITFLDKNDIFKWKLKFPIEQIYIDDIKDRELGNTADIIILNIDQNYKVLKSRY